MKPDVVAGARPGQRHEYLRTSCGRELTVARLALGDDRHPARRIFVDLGECPGCDGTGWAGLTVMEARRVAWALLSQAAAAEREPEAQAGPAGRITVRHAGGDAYAITVRGHVVLVDQPEADGGQDAAATPTEQPEPGSLQLVLIAYLQLREAELDRVLRRAVTALAPGGVLLVVGHDVTNLTEGAGGPQDPAVLHTPDRSRPHSGISPCCGLSVSGAPSPAAPARR